MQKIKIIANVDSLPIDDPIMEKSHDIGDRKNIYSLTFSFYILGDGLNLNKLICIDVKIKYRN